ncbi:MAG: ABC transporter ATP-binding protein [Eubacterium sp.]|jgi:ABC-type Fe3+/spermidine/putrescine transport system ATPase subunit|nr:ABC transporter ATP-binding protein [Eubacterium sp.]MCH4046610.1 ABC transporter ATP-binding protein [Eubacterium sp.]MCH4079706.1 ABC transporter ATP-binding protein [Eubacterium sp.]MCH4110266.1 ABC transporter ATP-binding protein [Eubacterium sp.]MCI1307121.1 ABC transporter ATP-binding protein [Eubacterium sp.]
MIKLSIENLRVQFGKHVILPDLSLQVEEGQFISLLGPSGCGKSTLLKAIAGIYPASQGIVRLNGNDITTLPPHKRNTVIVFQDMRLFPNMSVEENVAYPLKIRGVSAARRHEEAEKLLEDVQLKGYGERRIHQLSGGQQQRIALARALAARPDVLLLDEPFSALDENLREGMRSLVKELHRKFHMTTILVTHDRQEAVSMADKAAVMMDGQILQYAEPAEIYHHPANQKVFEFFRDCVYLSGSVENGIFRADSRVELPIDIADGNYDVMLKAGAVPEKKENEQRMTAE